MRNKLALTALLGLLLVSITGCNEPPVKIDHYDPVVSSADQKVVSRGDDKFVELDEPDLAVAAMLAGSRSVLVVLLKIENKSAADINAADYSIALVDGRDAKPLALIPRDAVIEYRRSLSTGTEIKSGNPMMDLALKQLNDMAGSLGSSRLKELIQSVDWAIDHYFAFRPLYAREAREGVLCYYSDFILEYPLTLKLEIKGKLIDLQFQPRQ